MEAEEPGITFDEELKAQLSELSELGDAFVRDIRSGLAPFFDGTVHPMSHARGDLPAFRGDNGVIVAWEFDGCVSPADEGPATFRGVGPLQPGAEVRFWGVHVFDQDLRVLRIVDEGPLRAQLGIVDAGRPLVEARPVTKGD